jgi:Transcriptional regulator, AbiEi antitoxin
MPDKGQTHEPLARLAEGQHGVVSVAQLAELGYSREMISYASRRARLRRVHRGVYAVGRLGLSWEGRCLAAVLACGTGAVASHATAAWLWGLLRNRPGTIHVTVPVSRRQRQHFRLHFAVLAAEDQALRDAIPLTALPRTLLDQAAGAYPTALERMLERAEERDLFDLQAIERLLERTGGHPGAGALCRALAIYRQPVAFTRSGLEKRFVELVAATEMPRPAMNVFVEGYELDAYWETERFAVELDVYETHGSHASFERDRLRQENLKLREIEMVRITGRRLEREPRAVIERVGALLRQRRGQLALD